MKNKLKGDETSEEFKYVRVSLRMCRESDFFPDGHPHLGEGRALSRGIELELDGIVPKSKKDGKPIAKSIQQHINEQYLDINRVRCAKSSEVEKFFQENYVQLIAKNTFMDGDDPSQPVKTFTDDGNIFRLAEDNMLSVNVFMRSGQWSKKFLMS